MAGKYGRVPVHLNRCVPVLQVLFNTLYEVPLNVRFYKKVMYMSRCVVLYISNIDEIKYNIVRILNIEMNTLIDEYMYQYKHIESPLFRSLFRLYFNTIFTGLQI